ncbi:MAG: alpha/beta fold hydrolase [Burkholderiales bacterium]
MVLLHGWGMNPAVFDDLRMRLSVRCDPQPRALPGYGGVPQCEPYTVHAMAASLATNAPERCFVAGWSLGGLVALAWARLAPRQVEGLVLLGTTPSFVQRKDWTTAIEARVLQEFVEALERDCAGTLKRFLSLQTQGDDAARDVLRDLRTALKRGEVSSEKTLTQGLQLLLDTDLRTTLPWIVQRTLVIHGERDVLTPLAAGEFLASALPSVRLVPIPGAAHAPFLSAPDAVSRAMLEFFDER